VGGVKFTVTYPTKLDNPDEVGESNAMERTIKIRADQKGDVLERTLLHEVIHAALGVGGVSEVLHGKAEEAVVVCLENALHALYERRR
jgi:hypothetical protein